VSAYVEGPKNFEVMDSFFGIRGLLALLSLQVFFMVKVVRIYCQNLLTFTKMCST